MVRGVKEELRVVFTTIIGVNMRQIPLYPKKVVHGILNNKLRFQ